MTNVEINNQNLKNQTEFRNSIEASEPRLLLKLEIANRKIMLLEN